MHSQDQQLRTGMGEERINVDAPLWEQSTFLGRFRHFAWMSNPLNGLVPRKDLLAAKVLSTF